MSNNSVVQQDGTTYIHVNDWYIGIHTDGKGDLLVFLDHENGKVVEYNEVIVEDEFQWGKAFHATSSPRRTPLPRMRTLRGTVKVEVTQ